MPLCRSTRQRWLAVLLVMSGSNFRQVIAAYGVTFDLEHVLVGRDNMALAPHNTARRGPLVLDEHLATVCTVQDDRIVSVETYLSDVY